MTAAIELVGLTKRYGAARGIEELTLTIEVGEVFGFLGPNGAGKTTTLRTLLNFLQPTRGRARVLGLDIVADSVEIRRRTGYLPGELVLDERMTGRECLRYFANLRRLDLDARIAALAERLALDLDRRTRDYSTGNRQKVGLINAFMHDPELLILDEPTAGLDPLMQQEFHALVAEARRAGRTVLLSSHILPEVDRVADRVGVVRAGRLLAVDTLAAFKARTPTTLSLEFAASIDPAPFAALAAVAAATTHREGRVLTLRTVGAVDAVLKLAAQHEVISITTRQGDLEEAFLRYYEPGDAR